MREEIARQALETWGHSAQIDMVIEECSELILALQHWKRGRVRSDAVASEVADVSIMLSQARIIFGSEDVDRARDQKIARLVGRLDAAALKSKEHPHDH
ncbi:hypothetical protein [uncultured Brevundimonas sp.]|uniref:hypothetical protein n=1 Tax=uncultured Brevundimonas sp. TaxID=213418 RepID=UPI002634942C|nr:hypothetical protein [uncultured Brevundimonas sp.]